jgi:hypothetical protein
MAAIRPAPEGTSSDERPLSAHSCLCASHREAATVAPKPPLRTVRTPNQMTIPSEVFRVAVDFDWLPSCNF